MHLLVCQKGKFSENSSASTSGEETAWHGMLWAYPVMTVTQSGLGLLVSGSSAQMPLALNRLPESLVSQVQSSATDEDIMVDVGGFEAMGLHC